MTCPSGCRIILSGKATCKQADPARRVERVDAGLPRRALLEQRALGRVLDPAGGVIADLLDRVRQGSRPEGEVIGRHHVVGDAGRRVGAQPVGDDLPEQVLASVEIVPELRQRLRFQEAHGCPCCQIAGVSGRLAVQTRSQDNRKAVILHRGQVLKRVIRRNSRLFENGALTQPIPGRSGFAGDSHSGRPDDRRGPRSGAGGQARSASHHRPFHALVCGETVQPGLGMALDDERVRTGRPSLRPAGARVALSPVDRPL